MRNTAGGARLSVPARPLDCASERQAEARRGTLKRAPHHSVVFRTHDEPNLSARKIARRRGELAKEFASHGTQPAWLEVNRDNYAGRVLSLPKREDIQLPVNEQLIVELYSK